MFIVCFSMSSLILQAKESPNFLHCSKYVIIYLNHRDTVYVHVCICVRVYDLELGERYRQSWPQSVVLIRPA